MTRVFHPGQPRCVHCGNTAGPWRPTGYRDPSGSQLFLCADGVGCDQPTYAYRVAARIRPIIDRAEQPLMLLADVLDLTVPEVRARYDGNVPWNLDEIEMLAALFGVTATSLLGVTE